MTYESTVLADSPSSYWILGEGAGSSSVADSGSGGFAGTPASVTFGSTALLAGSTATSASFNGTSSQISFGDHYAAIGTATFSAECWIQTPSSFDSANHYILSKEDNDATTSNRQGWHLGIDNTNVFRAERWHGNPATNIAATSAAISTSTLYHLVMTYDGSTIRLYLNAGTALTAADTNSIVNAATAPQFAMGSFNGVNLWWFNGLLSHVAIYNGVVLTSGQVTTHHTAGITTPFTGQKSIPTNISVTAGGWLNDAGSGTAANLVASIDEPDTPIDTDYIQSGANPSSDLVEYGLSSVTAPAVRTGHILRYRIRADQLVGGALTLVTELRQGASALSVPASFTNTTEVASITETTLAQTLTSGGSGQADAITDYTTLRIRHTATQAAAAIPSLVGIGTLVGTASNGQSFTPTIVNGTTGDLLVLVIIRNDNQAAPTVTGATNVAGLTGVSGVTATWGSVAVYTKYATSATGSVDQQAITFGTSTPARCGVWIRIANSHPTTPLHLSTKLNTGTTATTVNSTNLTSTITNTLGVFVAANIGARSTTNTTTNWTAGAGVTAFASQQTPLGNDLTIGYGFKTFAAAGSYLTPGIVWTTNTTTGDGYGLLLSIAPAANNSKARVTWAELELPAAAGGGAHYFRTLLGVGI